MAWNEYADSWWLKPRPNADGTQEFTQAFMQSFALAYQERQRRLDRQLDEKRLKLAEQSQDLNHQIQLHEMNDTQADEEMFVRSATEIKEKSGKELSDYQAPAFRTTKYSNAWQTAFQNKLSTDIEYRIQDEFLKKANTLDPDLAAEVMTLFKSEGNKISRPVIDSLSDAMTMQNKRKIELSTADELLRFGMPRTTSAEANAQAIAKYKSLAQQARAFGNTEAANQYDSMVSSITEQTAKQNLRVETYTDEQGRTQTRVIQGTGSASPGTQQPRSALLAARKALDLSNTLLSNLTPGSVGIAGKLTDIVVNRGLAQIFPELHEGQVASAQAMLRLFKANLIKTMRSDSNISEKEVQRIESAVPTDALASYEDIVARMVTLQQEQRQFAKYDALASGQPIAEWMLSLSEIRDMVKQGTITEAQALDLQQKYHPHWNLEVKYGADKGTPVSDAKTIPEKQAVIPKPAASQTPIAPPVNTPAPPPMEFNGSTFETPTVPVSPQKKQEVAPVKETKKSKYNWTLASATDYLIAVGTKKVPRDDEKAEDAKRFIDEHQ